MLFTQPHAVHTEKHRATTHCMLRRAEQWAICNDPFLNQQCFVILLPYFGLFPPEIFTTAIKTKKALILTPHFPFPFQSSMASELRSLSAPPQAANRCCAEVCRGWHHRCPDLYGEGCRGAAPERKGGANGSRCFWRSVSVFVFYCLETQFSFFLVFFDRFTCQKPTFKTFGFLKLLGASESSTFVKKGV